MVRQVQSVQQIHSEARGFRQTQAFQVELAKSIMSYHFQAGYVAMIVSIGRWKDSLGYHLILCQIVQEIARIFGVSWSIVIYSNID